MRINQFLIAQFITLIFVTLVPGISFAQDIVDNEFENEPIVENYNEGSLPIKEDYGLIIEVVDNENKLHNDEQLSEPEELDNSDSLLSEEIEKEDGNLEYVETGDQYIGFDNNQNELIINDEEFFQEDNSIDFDTENEKTTNEQHEELDELEQQSFLTLSSISTGSYSIGNRNERIRDLKYDLMKAGFASHWKNPTTYFGPDTEKVVKEFQKYYGLEITGVMDDKFLNKLEEVISSPFQFGNRSEEIKLIKQDLMKVGFASHWKNPTTYYGSDTTKVVKEFQQLNRLIINGIIDEVTRKRLQDMLENGFSRGMGSPAIKKYKEDLMKAGFGTHWKNPTTYFGADTEKVVRQFQNYYSLNNNGTFDDETLDKLNKIVTSPFQKGKRSVQAQEYKKDLMKVGFGLHWKNPSTLYGSDTEKVVKDFQKANNLVINGILDEVTLDKINELKSLGFVRGMRSEEIKLIKYDLMKAGFGTHWKNPTTYYGPDTEKVVKKFQSYYSLLVDGEMHIATKNKLNEVLSSPYQLGKISSEIQEFKRNLMAIGFGTHWKNPTTYYGPDTEKVVKEFQKANNLVVNGILDEVTLNVLNSKKIIKIFIDPGHGGTDPGAVSNGYQEKTFNLQIAKEIERYLKQYKNVQIKMARTKDTTVSLQQRTKMANDWGADYYVSVHINAGGGTGFESYIYRNPTQDEIIKQDIIHSHIANNISERDRGKKRAGYHVIRETNMSAILFEYLFIDNASDRNKLIDANYRKKLGRLTAEGIAKAFNLSKK